MAGAPTSLVGPRAERRQSRCGGRPSFGDRRGGHVRGGVVVLPASARAEMALQYRMVLLI